MRYFDPDCCFICGRDPDLCDCGECGVCGEVGDPDCHATHGLPFRVDSVAALIEHLGCGATLGENFRAIERHSEPMIGLWIVTADGVRIGSPETDKRSKANAIPPYMRIETLGVSGIAWDGSDWEYYAEEEVSTPFAECVPRLEAAFSDALAEWDAIALQPNNQEGGAE